MKLPQNQPMAYLLWVVSFALTLATLIAGRTLVMGVAGLFSDDYWRLAFVDRAAILLLSVAGLILVLFLEHYYRRGVEQRRLWPRFARVTILQVAILLASGLLALLAPGR
ncbi:hypothetical protein FKZ61_006625 [Litorilinea aerophila]|uniref:Uncharacterized protein n=1 Tax=Litorilinea aerophila TaxID=1204385 RepID=A0A540VKB5_9CHLR|nr:hypothetical protein [Litorilinea aerophila]MCC9075781.1 hypothetical protein [Litorilinea aerophila]OUC06013.1 hypothetical protein RY27_23655 [Litorilinea aerophila]